MHNISVATIFRKGFRFISDYARNFFYALWQFTLSAKLSETRLVFMIFFSFSQVIEVYEFDNNLRRQYEC